MVYFARPNPAAVNAPPVFGREFHNPHLAPANTTAPSAARMGDWTFRAEANTPYYLRWFGDYLESNTQGDTLEFWFTGRSFGFTYMIRYDGANFTVNVPGALTATPTPRVGTEQRLNTYIFDLGTDGWHRVVITNTDTEGRALRLGNFFLEREPVAPPRITAVEFMNRGRLTSSTSNSVVFPEETRTFNLIFSQPMDINSVTADRISIMRGNTPVGFSINNVAAGPTVTAFNRTRLEITLNQPITDESVYTVRVAGSITSQSVPMENDYVLTFESERSVFFTNHAGEVVTSLLGVNYVTANIMVESAQGDLSGVTVTANMYRGTTLLSMNRANLPVLRDGTVRRFTAGFNLPADRTNLIIRVRAVDSQNRVVLEEVILQ